MVSVAEAFVTMRPDFDGFGRQTEAGVRRGMGGIAKVAAGAFAAVGVGRLLGDAIGDAGESRKIARLTKQSIKTTGKAAGVSAKQVGAMSESLGVMAGVDDEVIQQGANLLLTFKKVRNETGKGNKIFDRAAKAGLDMAAQGFGSPTTNAVQLGKALQDPLKGITALSRAGVTFTEQQKKQIKSLVESNDVLGAQKIILDEVEGQVGGAAKASADPLARLSVISGNLKEQLGGALLPVVDRVATFLGDKLPGAIDAVTKAFDQGGLGGVVSLVATKIGDALPGILRKLGEWGAAFLGWIGPRIPPLLVKLGELAGRVGRWLIETGLPRLVEKLAEWGRALIEWIGPRIGPTLEKMGELLGRLGTWILQTGLPLLATKLGEWGAALLKWIVDAAVKLPDKISSFVGRLVEVSENKSPEIESAWKKIGGNLVDAFWQGIKDEWPNLLFKVQELALDLSGFKWELPWNNTPAPETPGGFGGGDFGGGGGRSFDQPRTVPRGVTIGSLSIHNPIPEPARESIPAALRRAEFLTGF